MALFATKPSTTQTTKPHLLALPPELREQIFSHAVTSPKQTVTFRLDKYQLETYDQARQPLLTLVNKQIRRETLPLYYGNNDFVLHTEGLKSEDAARWLRSNEIHLSRLGCVKVWVRYVGSNERTPGSGALEVECRHDVRSGKLVVGEEWRWITVVRRPEGVEWDGKLLVTFLGQLVGGRSRGEMGAEDVLRGLRGLYVKDKMNQAL
jgi:hypothetical protein